MRMKFVLFKACSFTSFINPSAEQVTIAFPALFREKMLSLNGTSHSHLSRTSNSKDKRIRFFPAAQKSTLGWILPGHCSAQLSLCLHLVQLCFNLKLTLTQHFLWKVRGQNRLVIKAQGFQVQLDTLWVNFGALLT